MAAPKESTEVEDKSLQNEPPRLNWYNIMDRMIGENRQRFVPLGTPIRGIPPAQPPEMVRVQTVMESCPFKAGIAFAGGERIVSLSPSFSWFGF